MEKKKKYYYLSFDSFGWMIIGLVATIGSFVLGFLSSMANWIWITSMLLFIIGIAAIIVPPIISNGREIKKAYDGLLELAISEAIDATTQKKDKEWYVQKYRHYLSEIKQADNLNPIDLNIDDDKFDNLFTLKGALSITSAPLVAWKDPEYNWFLVANYMATLNKRYTQTQTQGSESKQLELIERNKKEFQDFINNSSSILNEISKGNYHYDDYVRLYILSQEEIAENKAMLEQMIAGHELFGIHLYVIDKDVLSDIDVKYKFGRLNGSVVFGSNSIVDIMIYKDKDNNMKIKYPYEGRLEDRPYADLNSNGNIDSFITALAKFVSNNAKYMIYPPRATSSATITMGSNTQVQLNQNFTFVNIKVSHEQ